jgi:hypothetical protein
MIFAGSWVVLSTLWFVYVEIVLGYNIAAIACGYPDAKAHDDCIAKYQHKINSFLFERMITQHGLWIVVPALILLAIGIAIATRRRTLAS